MKGLLYTKTPSTGIGPKDMGKEGGGRNWCMMALQIAFFGIGHGDCRSISGMLGVI